MTAEPEWGPWIKHDGKSIPVKAGELVHVVFYDNDEWTGIEETSGVTKFGHPITPDGDDPWSWIYDYPVYHSIIRYRIRKPRSMKLLQSLVENPPKQLIKEDA